MEVPRAQGEDVDSFADLGDFFWQIAGRERSAEVPRIRANRRNKGACVFRLHLLVTAAVIPYGSVRTCSGRQAAVQRAEDRAAGYNRRELRHVPQGLHPLGRPQPQRQ
jgi:hypothetical protein